MRLCYHLTDVTLVSAWLLHRKDNKEKPNMSLSELKIDLARTLLTNGHSCVSKRGRPSGMQPVVSYFPI